MSSEENFDMLSEHGSHSDQFSEYDVLYADDTNCNTSCEYLDYFDFTESVEDDTSLQNDEDEEDEELNEAMKMAPFYFYAFKNITYTKLCTETSSKIYQEKWGHKNVDHRKSHVKQSSTDLIQKKESIIRKPVFSGYNRGINLISDGYFCSHGIYDYYTQKVCSDLETLLFSCDQISMLYDHNKLIRRKMGNTLKIVATPDLVKNLGKNVEPLILYSLVGCLPKGEIIFPVADKIIRHKMPSFIEAFFDEIKIHCHKHQHKWPLCQRFITDVDFEIVSAVLVHFNQLDIQSYLKICYNMLFSKKGQVKSSTELPENLVTLQFSPSNYSNHILHEMKQLVGNKKPEIIEFVMSAFRIVFNLFKIPHCIIWFRRMCTVLLSPYWSKRVEDCFKALTSHLRRMPDVKSLQEAVIIPAESLGKLREACKRSPFKQQFLIYYLQCRVLCIKAAMEESASAEARRNVYYCPKVVKMLMDNCIAMLPFWSNIVGIQIEPNQFHTEIDEKIEDFYAEIKNEQMRGKPLELGQFTKGYEDFIKLQIADLRNYY